MSEEKSVGDNGPLSDFPIKLGVGDGVHGWLEEFGDGGVRGWALPARPQDTPVTLVIVENEIQVGFIHPVKWRQDVAEINQGDGRSAFNAPPPISLRDGKIHQLDIRERGLEGPSILSHPLTVRMSEASDAARLEAAQDAASKQTAMNQDGPIQFSFVVNFYNMRREAERTLTALTSSYQRDAEGISWEVLCIDNGSDLPLEEDWIKSFGPQFRLIRPSRKLPSPCFAMNEAARLARGRYIALMIDGAHVVTPGAIREAADAFAERPDAIVGLRQWFFGGDQRWLSAASYTREMEDILFGKIDWPNAGYRLFEVSTPMMPSANSWFDSASESNCLFVPSTLFEELGGYDEAFDIPGGGLSNLDLFSKAAAAASDVVMLVGEASFHQFHGGTTTNVDNDKKDSLVRSYLNDFKRMRGEKLKHVESESMRFRGRMPTQQGALMRQRPVFSGSIGVTDRIRFADHYHYFDSGAEKYVIGFAVENGMFDVCNWLGQPTGVGAGDLLSVQEILHSRRPTRVIAVNQPPGMLSYIESVLSLLGNAAARLVCVGVSSQDIRGGHDNSRRIISGRTCDPATLDAVRRALEAETEVFVVFQPDPGDDLPVESIRAYMDYVSLGSFMLITRTAFGQPWIGYSRNWSRRAIQQLTSPDSEFRVDHSWERQIITACPWGYLRRVSAKPLHHGQHIPIDDLDLI